MASGEAGASTLCPGLRDRIVTLSSARREGGVQEIGGNSPHRMRPDPETCNRMNHMRREADLTFFVWADTHYGYEQQFAAGDLRGRIIAQMNALPGWPYPPAVEGVVQRPEFVVLCGDAVDGKPGAGAEELAYFRYYTRQLNSPQIEVMGNHDTDPQYVDYFRAQYGGLSHSWEGGGVHCIGLNCRFDPGEVGHFEEEELLFLRSDLASVAEGMPVVLFVHSRLDRATNGHKVLQILAGHDVVLIVSAHVHKPAVFQLEGIDCIDVGQCRDHPIDPEYGRNLCVVHVTDQRVTAVPWRWDQGDWERGRRWADPEATMKRFTLNRRLEV